MRKSRRRFLQNVTVAALAALSTRLRVAKAAPAEATFAVDYDTLVPLIDKDFGVWQDSEQVASLRLVAVKGPTSTKGYGDPLQAARNSFTLILRSAQPSALKEGIYTFNNPKLAAFSAFISPITGDQRTYQIVYNHNSH